MLFVHENVFEDKKFQMLRSWERKRGHAVAILNIWQRMSGPCAACFSKRSEENGIYMYTVSVQYGVVMRFQMPA